MKTVCFALVGMMMLQACTPPVPASNAGPGFNDYSTYELERARREAQINGSGSTTFQAPSAVQTGAIGSSDLAAAGIGQSQPQTQGLAPMSATDPSSRVGTIEATPGNAAPALMSNVGISDEQDFEAVASRESIQSDAQRRAATAANREQIMPTAVPTRSDHTGPNIVEYALNAPNRKGQEWYSRSIFASKGRFQRNCVEFTSPDAAQRYFLENGGPEKNPRGLDPDGDGFACGWDPAPFLAAVGR